MDDTETRKQEAFALITELIAVESSERRERQIIKRLNQICLDPGWSNHIYYKVTKKDADGNTDVQAVVDDIFSYKPILG